MHIFSIACQNYNNKCDDYIEFCITYEYVYVYGRVIAWDLNAHSKMCWEIKQHIVIQMNNKAQLK